MPGTPFLVGDRVTIRTLEPEDLPFVRDGVNHPAVRTRVGQSIPTNLPMEERYFREANENRDAVQVLVTVDGDRAGVVELDPIDRETGVADVAFWLHPDSQGSGYAREALELVLSYAFDELRLHKVTANAYPFNDGSLGLLRRLGFVEEGVGREDTFVDGDYRDTHYFGLLDREWRARD